MAGPSPAVYSHIAIIARLEVLAEQLATTSSSNTSARSGADGGTADEDPTEQRAESSVQAALQAEDEEGAWQEIEGELERIADGLRTKETRAPLGTTSLPSLLVTLARLILLLPPHISSSTASAVVAHHTQHTPAELPSIERLALAENEAVAEQTEHGRVEWAEEIAGGTGAGERTKSVKRRAGVVKQIGRVAANLCIDEDDNREKLALYQYPAALLQLLSVYATDLERPSARTDERTIGALKGLVGSALNAALGDAVPIKAFLLQPAALDVLLSLYQALLEVEATPDGEDDLHSLAVWLWRTIGAAASEDSARTAPSPRILQTAIRASRMFLPRTHSSAVSAHRLAGMAPADALLVLMTACALLERAYLDVPASLSELVRGDEGAGEEGAAAHGAGAAHTYLGPLLEFVELAEPLATWEEVAESEDEEQTGADADADAEAGLSAHEKWERQLGVAKASVLRVLVELSGEVNLADASRAWLRDMLFGWLEKRGRGGSKEEDQVRPDLVACALLCLGNFARTDARVTDLLSATHSPALLPSIRPLLRGSTDVQVQHALVGLLKNLAIPKANKAALGRAGILEGLCDMGVWLPAKDTVGSVQGGGVGVAKHLCYGNVPNALRIANSLSATTKDGALRQLLALSRRTDDAAIRCEVARVWVNVTRALYMADATAGAGADADAEAIAEGKRCMADEQIVRALLGLLAYGQTSGHAILINEAVLALALICQDEAGLGLAASQLGTAPTEPTSALSDLLSLLDDAQPRPAPPPTDTDNALNPVPPRTLLVPPETKRNIVILLRLVSGAWQVDGAHEEAVERTRTVLLRLAQDEQTDAKLAELLRG